MASRDESGRESPSWEGAFRRLAENAPAVLFQFRMTPDGSYSLPFISERVQAMAGVPAEDVMRDPSALEAFLYPDDRAVVNRTVMESAARMEPFHLECRGLRKGEVVWVEAHAVPEPQPDGSILWDGILTDITQRRQAEEDLRESEERYHTFVQRSSEGIYRAELETPIPVHLPVEEQVDLFYDWTWVAECNQRFAEMYGADSPEELLGRRVEEFHGGRNHPGNREHVRRMVAAGYRVTGEETVESTLTGEVRYFSNSILGIIEDGMLMRIWGSQADITEQRRARIRLEETARRIARQNEIIARAASSPAAGEGDVAGLSAEITEAVATTFGIERVGVWLFNGARTELVCLDLFEGGPGRHSGGAVLTAEEFAEELEHLRKAKYIDAEDALSDPRLAGYVKGYLEPLGITSLLDGVIRVGGETLGVLCLERVGRPHQWEPDEIAFACQLADQLGMAIQSRERRAAQATLRESEARWHFALEGAGDGVWDWNAETGEVFFSPRWKAMLGYGEEEIGNTFSEWRDRVHPDDLEAAEKEVRRHLEGEAPSYVSEHRLRCKDGSYKWILDRGKVLTRDREGRPQRVIGTHTDITERKRGEVEKERLQAQFLQSQKMESVGRLAGGVAHDFNNMLSVILGHAELALARLHPTDATHADLLEIQKAGLRSADLTRQLLAFARLQTVAPRVLDLNDTAGGMLKMLQRLIGEDIELAWLPAPALWPVRMDAAQLDQVLANLCVNARDAIADGGRITIETENVSFDEAFCANHSGFRPGDFVMLAVSDDGAGMTKEVLDHLFEPFFTTKEVGQGTGLGLATVYGIVKQNDGFISVYSEPGVGTTFKIYLPRAAGGAEECGSGAGQAAPRARGETVLLVEDEAAILRVGRAMLRQLGYQVLSALTPGEAMEAVRSHPGEIHLLVTDVVMPEMNGRELAGRLKEIRPGMRVLFISGYTADVIAHHGVLDEGVQFIQKPFSLKDLALKARETLRG